jgi:hypothetical protein
MGFSVIPEPAISGFTGPQGPAGTIPSDPTFTGSMAVNDTSGDPNIDIKKNGSLRWKIRSAGSETGSNNGSDLWVEAFDDSGAKLNDPIWISRTLGQVSIGIANSTQSGVALSVNGAIGTRDTGTDPATTTMGAQLYSKAGKLWVQTASGAEKFQVVKSVATTGNSQIDGQYVWLSTAAGTYRAFGYKTAGVDRWLFQVDDTAESGSNAGSNFRLSARNDDGSFNKTVVYASRSTGQIAFNTTTIHGTATATLPASLGLRDTTDPATTTGGVFIYSKGGLAYVKQGDGTVFQLAAGGGGGAVSSVNGYTGAVTLTASDVGALKANDAAYQTSVRAIFQGDGTNNIMEWRNPTGGLAARIGANGNFVGQGAAYMAGGLQVGSSSTNWGGGSGAMLGLNDATTIPTTNPTAGVVVYSEGGVLKIRQADGTIVTATNAADLTNYVQNSSSPTFNDFMIINASAATNYGTVALRKLNKKRWSFAVTGASETGSDVGSNFIIQSYTDDEADKTYHLFADRASGSTVIGSTNVMNGARLAVDGGALGIVDQGSDPTSSSLGAHFYSKAGRPWVKRSTGATGGTTQFEILPRGNELQPEDLGLAAWTGNPAACMSTGAYSGTTNARVAAVYLREPKSISKIVWHFRGYAGGLLANSWAAVYNSSGTRMVYNDAISTGANEPATVVTAGGDASYVPVTATTLPPGLYYIVWRFVYTTSPVDGPELLQYENSAAAPPNVFGLNGTKLFGVYDASSQNSSYTSLTIGSMQRSANRFWAALA